MNAITEPVSRGSFSLAPQSLDEALRFAEMLAESSIIPKDFAKNPGNILVAIQWGMELGLQPMQAMQNIAVINGRPALWGDAVIALVRSSPLCEYVYETIDGDVATCRVKRRGEEEQVRTFSLADAKAAGLIGKQGPWTQYPKRMLQLRARAFALRDVFPDVLRGMPVAEEVMDMQKEREVAPQVQKIDAPKTKPDYEQAKFESMMPTWQKGVDDGKTTPEDLKTFLESKYTLSAEQIERINQMTPIEGEVQP